MDSHIVYPPVTTYAFCERTTLKKRGNTGKLTT